MQRDCTTRLGILIRPRTYRNGLQRGKGGIPIKKTLKRGTRSKKRKLRGARELKRRTTDSEKINIDVSVLKLLIVSRSSPEKGLEHYFNNNNSFSVSKVNAKGPKTTQPQPPTHKKKSQPKKPKKSSLIDEKCDWNGTMFPFKGTSELYCEVEMKEESDYDDDEWDNAAPTKTNTTIKLNNALGALMGAYMSDDEEMEEEAPKPEPIVKTVPVPVNVVPVKEETELDEDDGPPLEVKIQKEDHQEHIPEKPTATTETATTSNKTSKRTKNRKRVETRKENRRNRNTGKSNTGEKNEGKFPYDNFKKRPVTLLEKLLESEIRHERNVLLQCVRYVVSNNFFMDSKS